MPIDINLVTNVLPRQWCYFALVTNHLRARHQPPRASFQALQLSQVWRHTKSRHCLTASNRDMHLFWGIRIIPKSDTSRKTLWASSSKNQSFRWKSPRPSWTNHGSRRLWIPNCYFFANIQLSSHGRLMSTSQTLCPYTFKLSARRRTRITS